VTADRYAEADQAAMTALHRARLLRRVAFTLQSEPLARRLLSVADELITEAFANVILFGAEPGEAYFHEPDGQFCLGWALTGGSGYRPAPAHDEDEEHHWHVTAEEMDQ
jgi:hypothetical protein